MKKTSKLLKARPIWILCLFLALCLSVGIIGGFATNSSVTTWYPTLMKPTWTPPSWVFGPVWTVLYVLIALCGWLIYMQPSSPARSKALLFFGIQLVLNLIWSPLFFGLQSPLLGLITIVLLWIAILATLFSLWKVSRLAAALWLPYTIWVTYALTLNAAIYVMN